MSNILRKQTPAHSVKQIKSLTNNNKIQPPQPKSLPEFKKIYPNDCEGPLFTPYCEHTCKLTFCGINYLKK